MFWFTCFGEVSFFLQFRVFDSRPGHLWSRFQFSASQYLQVRSFGLSFGLLPYCPVCVILCIGSSLMSFSRFDVRVSGMVFFLLFLSYMFCCICPTAFGTSKSLFFNSWSRNFVSLIDIINFDISNSVLKSWKSHSFSSSNNFTTNLPAFPYLFCPKKSPCVLYWFLLGRYYLLYKLITFSTLIFFGWRRYWDRVVWCVASGPNALRKSWCIVSSLVFHSDPVIVSSLITGPISTSYFRFVYCLNRSIHCQ